MPDDAATINRHYGGQDLSLTILSALERAGKNLNALTREDLAAFDELHSGGREATRGLAQQAAQAGLRPGMQVLDVGSGIGGPARTLGAEFSATVVGLDLTEAFCHAATMLTTRVGLADRVSFQHGDALAMPFRDETFDVVWSQNTIMNIGDKPRLLTEMHRVLRPDGLLVFEAIFAGPVPDPHFPVFWADDPSASSLIPSSEFRGLLTTSGFRELLWNDVTAAVVAMTLERQAAAPASRPLLGLHVVYTDVPRKAANVLRNFQERRIVQVQGICRRVAS